MNYYEHHLGDFMRDTAHLTMVEECAYRRLLDAYYIRERALPGDVRDCCKLARAATKPERDAVAYVLREFFELREDGHHQGRADREIARFSDKRMKAKASADARWNGCERNANALQKGMRTHSERNADGMHRAPVPSPQTPNTRNQERAVFADPPPSSARAPGPDPENPTPTPTPTPAGAVCRAIRQRGMADVNPSDPRLLALLEQGATEAEIVGIAGEAVDKGKGWAWVLHVVAARRADAASLHLAAGTAPQRQAANAAPSFEDSQSYLRAQSDHRAVPPPPEVLAKLRSVVKVVS